MTSTSALVARSVTRTAALVTAWLCLPSSAAFARYSPALFPNELSLGFGATRDRSPAQWSPSLVGAMGWDWNEQDWAVLVVEAEIAAFSEAEPCRQSPDDFPDNCFDAAVAAGLRFRPPPRTWSGVSYFGSVLAGQYWKGSGTNDDLEVQLEPLCDAGRRRRGIPVAGLVSGREGVRRLPSRVRGRSRQGPAPVARRLRHRPAPLRKPSGRLSGAARAAGPGVQGPHPAVRSDADHTPERSLDSCLPDSRRDGRHRIQSAWEAPPCGCARGASGFVATHPMKIW